ncbi:MULTISPECIES: PepSY-associated TM helix domain-containing protein [unclassified Oceanobacter]|uniref:PepSY-associated TM helix domain-containing protein n=1 Tax=unclassified Oceanobacter TaxID=2620260 RepID=UPI00273355EC|nr:MULTISPECIES: PepSY-associated TM helix domain-containing protein [unclassified Oceanobacter]MDP2607913.1 PepSY-associated TM helix domain-containing protein [Oceanobacter sp. 1_MG-2023]MDP2611425.1 PepSY-associated TM helix domain-containing protein [Oceanobacter sp. 2_MG-2023]
MKLVPFLIHWHRRGGLIILPVLLMLAITGILINHSQSLGWAKTPVYSSWIAWLYGIQDTTVEQGFAAGDHWVSQVGDTLYLDHDAIGHCDQPLLGALRWQETIALLCNNRIALYLPDGQLVEELGSLPLQASTLGMLPDQDALLLSSPPYYLDNNSWSWQPLPPESVPTADSPWATLTPLPAELVESLNKDKPLPGISRERLLLDLHSGRLFGEVGVWVVDAVSLVLIFLALSGTLTWLKRAWLKRGGRHGRHGCSRQKPRRHKPGM